MLSFEIILCILSGLNVGYAVLLNLFRISSFELFNPASTLLEFLCTIIGLVVVCFALSHRILGSLIVVIAQFVLSWYIHRKYVVGRTYSTRDLHGKVYIITGCNSGIGFEIAKALVSMNATVIMACRSLVKANIAKDQILRKVGCSPTKLHVLKLDLCGFDSVRKFVKAFKELNLPLDGLINNASVMLEDRVLTQDGFEMVFTSNHLSHFLLTCLLLPVLERSKGRVITMSSSAHYLLSSFEFDNIMSEKRYDMIGTYARSKLANILFTKELQRRLLCKNSDILCVAVHPGSVRTEIPKNMNLLLQLVSKLASPLMLLLQKTPQQGAYCSIYAAVEPSLTNDRFSWGKYFYNCCPMEESVLARDPVVAQKLWDISEKLTGISS